MVLNAANLSTMSSSVFSVSYLQRSCVPLRLLCVLRPLTLSQQAFRRYPALRERFNSVVVNFFKTAMTPTTKLVSDMVAMQACYVNTTHPDFLNGHKVRLFLSLYYLFNPFSRPWHSSRIA